MDRATHIGASEVATLFGLGFQTEYELWLSKTGQVEPSPGNDATEIGLALEPLLLDRAERDLGPLDRQVVCVSQSYPVLRATCDAIVRDEWELVEAKTSGVVRGYADRERWGDPGTDEIPEAYILQVHAQMLCACTDVCHVYAMLGGRGFTTYRVERNEDLVQEIGRRATEWWRRHVVERQAPSAVPPPPLDVLKRVKREPGSVCELPPGAEAIVEAVRELRRRSTEIEREKDAATSALVAMLGTCEAGVLPSGATVTYIASPRRGYTVEPGIVRKLQLPKETQ